MCPRLCARFWEYNSGSETKPVPAFQEFTDEWGQETVIKYHMKLLYKESTAESSSRNLTQKEGHQWFPGEETFKGDE